MSETDRSPRVVVVGSGFGGMAAARGLNRAPVQVTIVDRSNHRLFQPLLYQVATAALSPADIAAPIRRVFRHQSNVRVMLADATGIDVERKRVVLADGTVDYDVLILAAGVTHAYFGHDAWALYAPGLKTLKDALTIRQHMLLAFEIAERELNPDRQRAWLTVLIVGGGPTGVELAGTLAEVSRQTLARDFRHVNTASARVILVEASPRVLGTYTDELSNSARLQLEKLGVTVWTGMQVTSVDADGVSIGPERIDAKTVVWAAGVAGSPLAKTLGVPLDRAGRVLVESDLTIPGHDNVYVVGDLAHIENQGALVPGRRAAAMQMGWPHRRRTSYARCRGNPASRFNIVIKECSPPLGAAPRLQKLAPSRHQASSPGCSGCSFTSFF